MPRRRRVTRVIDQLRPEWRTDARAQIFTMEQIASMMGWPVPKTRRWLTKTGAAVKRGAGRGIWITTPHLLMAHFPEVWAATLGREVAE